MLLASAPTTLLRPAPIRECGTHLGRQQTSRDFFTGRSGDRESENFGFTLPTTTKVATQSSPARWGGMSTLPSWALTEQIIAACIEVHRELGPGLLESIYEECLCDELTARGLRFERQKPLVVTYKGRPLDQGYRVDLIVEGLVLVEVKAVEALLAVHAAQVVTYLRLSKLETGLLVNFNSLTIQGSLRRLSRTPKNSRSPDLPVKKSGTAERGTYSCSVKDSPGAVVRRRSDHSHE